MATARIDIDHCTGPVPLRTPFGGRSDDRQPGVPASHVGNPAANRAGNRNGVLDIASHYAIDRRFVPAGTELFAEGETSDNLYIVLEGWLFQHRILEDGRRQILDFALPGSVIGYRAHPQTPFAFSAEAITNAKVAIVPLNRVSDMIRSGSECALTLLEAANEALPGAFDTLTDIGRRTARESIAHFLLRMDRRIRRCTGSDGQGGLPFPLSQEHIGDALGLTSVHVCRTLSKLRSEGLVETGRGRLRIVDIDALSEDAGVAAPEAGDLRLAS